jgi:hypothetical protein
VCIKHAAPHGDQARADHVAASSDTNCMHAMLQDAGRYIEHLRSDNAILLANLQHARAESMSFAQAAAHAHAAAEDIKASASREQGGFAMDNIKHSIETAVAEIQGLEEEDRKKQIKALRLRWHPDKNPILTEFATEVSKILNAAVLPLLPPPPIPRACICSSGEGPGHDRARGRASRSKACRLCCERLRMRAAASDAAPPTERGSGGQDGGVDRRARAGPRAGRAESVHLSPCT